MREPNGTATGAKLLTCLDALSQSKVGLSTSEVSVATRLSRTSAGRLLDTLLSYGYVMRDRDKRYHLSLRMLELGIRVQEALAPIAASRQELVALADALRRDTFLMLVEGSTTSIVERADWMNGRAVTRPHTTRSPWQATASGRVIAAFSTSERQKELLSSLDAHVAKAVSLRFPDIRAAGYDIEPSAQRPDRIGASAPILAGDGTAMAAIGAYFAPGELEPSAGNDALGKLLDAADRVSSALGFTNAQWAVAI